LFNTLVRLTGEVETNIIAVERVLEYTQLPSEAPDIIPTHRPAISWPAHGVVRFIDYSTRYRPGLDLVLRNINLDIKAKEKIGVVGRTGAGKSSLALSLFRIIEASSGSIHIDNLDISTIGLLDLRQRLTIIPQDAALFEGTVRDNLDPGKVHDDTELWTTLGRRSFPFSIVWRYSRTHTDDECRPCATEETCSWHVWWAGCQGLRRG
jgi:ABC-type multidrug transport system fused ATPase/permease subunit